MAKSILSSLLNTTVKVVDKSIKQAARERQRQAKAAQRERERTAKAAERERIKQAKERERQAKSAGNQPTRSVEVGRIGVCC
jgi:RNA polymerase-binding transcription factor DksA